MQDTHRQPFPHLSPHLLPRQLTFQTLGIWGLSLSREGVLEQHNPPRPHEQSRTC